MNRSSHFSRGVPDRNQGLLLRLLVSLGVLLTVTGTRATTLSLLYDKAGNQSSQEIATTVAPSILSQPGNQGVPPGGTAGFAVTATGSLPLTYQWFFNNAAINGATKDSLLLTNVSKAQEGSYTVKIINSGGEITTLPAQLFIDINNNSIPDAWELNYFGNLNNAADGDADGDGTSNLDEYHNSTDPLIIATNTWTAASGALDDPNNWSLGHVPTVHEEAVINSGAFALPTSGVFAATKVTVNVPYTMPAGTNQNLNISGNWTFNDTVALAPDQQFAVTGEGGSVTFSGPTTLNGVSLLVYGGATLNLPSVKAYSLPAGSSAMWDVQNDRSLLNFPALTTITGNDSPGCYLTLRAINGGSRLILPALTTISKPDDGDNGNNSGVSLQAYNSATLSAPLLVTFSDNDRHPDSSLLASDRGVLALPKLLTAKGIDVINVNALSNPQQFTSLVLCGHFILNSGTVSMENLNTIEGLIEVTAQDGAQLSFPKVTSYTVVPDQSPVLQAVNESSSLSFPRLTTITGNNSPGFYLTLRANNDASLVLPALTTITKPDDGDGGYNSGVSLQAYNRATLSAPLLATFNDNDRHPNSSLLASDGGVLALPKLLTTHGIDIINVNALSNPQQFTSLVLCGHFILNSGTVSMDKLSSIAGLIEITAQGGAQLTFPKVTSYTVRPDQSPVLQAVNEGSVLTLPRLTTITGNNSPGAYLTLRANNDASLVLPALTTITKPDDGDGGYNSGVSLQAYNRATLSAPLLATFNDNDRHPNSSLLASDGGVLALPKLLTTHGIDIINVNALSNPQQFTSLVLCGHFILNSGTVSMDKLSSIAGLIEITAQGGAKLSFPKVTTYTVVAGQSPLLQAVNDGSVLSFPHLTNITGNASPGAYLTLRATAGESLLSLPVLTTITKPDDGDGGYNSGVSLQAYNGGTIFAPLLATFTDNDAHPNSSLITENGGTLVLTSLAQAGVAGVTLNGLTLPANPSPLITSAPSAASVVGKPFTYTIKTAKTDTLSYAASGLPANLQINTSSGVISGTGIMVGSYRATISATNAQGTTETILTIVINPPAPGTASGLAYSGLVNQSANSAGEVGAVKFTFMVRGNYTVKLTIGGKAFSGKGKLDQNGNLPVNTWGTGINAVSLTPVWSTDDQIEGTVTRANGNLVVPFAAACCPYSAANLLPQNLQGKYTAKLPLQNTSSKNPTLRGTGYMTMVVAKTGLVTYVGKTADGTTFSGGTALTSDLAMSLYAPLYKAKGALIGSTDLESTASTDVGGTLKWFRPITSGIGLFAPGWPQGLALSVSGSRYTSVAAAKAGTPAVAPFSQLPAADADGNVNLTLALQSGSVSRKLNLSRGGAFTNPTQLGAGEKLSLKLTAASGVITGSYQASASSRPFALSGVLLQKSGQAIGFTLDVSESATLDLELSP